MKKRHDFDRPKLFFNSRMRSGSLCAEQYRIIRSNLDILQKRNAFKSLLITSPGKKEGKTTVAINLAVLMARQGNRVLIIDADALHPVIHQFFSLNNNEGLIDVLKKKESIESLVQETAAKNLYVLAGKSIDPETAEWIGIEQISDLMNEAAAHFDRIIVDASSVLMHSSTPLFANRCDGTVIVAKTNATRKKAINEAKEKLIQAQAKILGLILNDYPVLKQYLA
ncbi:CpsD/CapB family tyrosine-protein kinase [Sporolactobacillus shoreicorticis]|uniref:non-specific protein-tyrosine kinase n=1 Tax=Sporolactobacillus shoreicorticis TaxID=1923877 RepID=A0ABW5S2W7_9BACL|nr:CpsD/CapB family tyrosine-protein kinase [Sporolactobacillus shoreicorticis]MCO7124201.1 CpsD/CapB family tyrosine-protein kinase [Sporolactobacillus shoreicorticis]